MAAQTGKVVDAYAGFPPGTPVLAFVWYDIPAPRRFSLVGSSIRLKPGRRRFNSVRRHETQKQCTLRLTGRDNIFLGERQVTIGGDRCVRTSYGCMVKRNHWSLIMIHSWFDSRYSYDFEAKVQGLEVSRQTRVRFLYSGEELSANALVV